MSTEPVKCKVCLFLFMGKRNIICNLFILRPPTSFDILFTFSLLTSLALSPVSLSLLSFVSIHPSSSTPRLQWRASGWSGGRGPDAASPATRDPSRGRDDAARRSTAGPNVKAPIRRAETAPTLHAVVRLHRCLVFMLASSQVSLCRKRNMCYLKASHGGLEFEFRVNLWFGTQFGL